MRQRIDGKIKPILLKEEIMQRYYERIFMKETLWESQTLQKSMIMSMLASFNQMVFRKEL